MTVNLQALTAKKNAFLWLPEHQEYFEKVKQLLTSDMVVTHFDPNLPVTVLTDASCLHGPGYAMGHFIDGTFKVVACGSKFSVLVLCLKEDLAFASYLTHWHE